MANYTAIIKRNSKPNTKTLRDDIAALKDKDFFRPTGTQMYVGSQGSGKTISAVHHLLKLKKKYPKAKVVTNLSLKVPWEYIHFDDMDSLSHALVSVNNGKYGVIYIIDEIHTYFNALDSKNIPMFVFTEISQQRKQRKLIIGTSQLFLRAAKPLREQCDNVIVCKTFGGIFTIQTAYDGESLEQDYSGKLVGSKRRTGWFIHDRKTREAFDTFQKVVSGFEQYDTQKPMQIEKHGLLKKKYTMK